ncbi:hypothetical protein FRAHR75_320046 [Frankia sp. Hr75.2]|nr:hypothetical protein FRAHR75_320046 [Frankia sp. Hr75.2]
MPITRWDGLSEVFTELFRDAWVAMLLQDQRDLLTEKLAPGIVRLKLRKI